MEGELKNLLLTAAGLTDIVGEGIDWGWREQGSALPAVTLTLVSRRRLAQTDGPTPLEMSQVQADCWGATETEVLAMARAIATRLHGRSFRSLQTPILGIFFDGEQSFFEGEAPERLHRRTLDFRVWHHPSAA